MGSATSPQIYQTPNLDAKFQTAINLPGLSFAKTVPSV